MSSPKFFYVSWLNFGEVVAISDDAAGIEGDTSLNCTETLNRFHT